MATTRFNIGAAWTLIGVGAVDIQLTGSFISDCRLHFGAAEPDQDTLDFATLSHGIYKYRGAANVYARAMGSETSIIVSEDGSSGGGDASAANQVAQTALLTTIDAAVALAATENSLSAIKTNLSNVSQATDTGEWALLPAGLDEAESTYLPFKVYTTSRDLGVKDAALVAAIDIVKSNQVAQTALLTSIEQNTSDAITNMASVNPVVADIVIHDTWQSTTLSLFCTFASVNATSAYIMASLDGTTFVVYPTTNIGYLQNGYTEVNISGYPYIKILTDGAWQTGDSIDWVLTKSASADPYSSQILAYLQAMNVPVLPRLLTDAGAPANIKAASGVLSWLSIRNTFDFEIYVQLFNEFSDDVVLGTTTPVLSLVIPAQGFISENLELYFDSAISCAVTDTATGSTTKLSTINATYK